MTKSNARTVLYGALLALSVSAPWIVPSLTTQLTFLWLMIVFALTWDILGGQTGYNSFGNVLFFGVGMYACAVVQRDFGLEYHEALALGMALGAVASVSLAALLGPLILGLRGHYFAIATLGLGVVAADLASAWNYIGAGSGLAPPIYPGAIGERERFFYYILMALGVATFVTLRWLYSRRFGLAVNAIRDDEDKAEAMGLRTTRFKTTAWCVAAFFLGLAGGPIGDVVGFIDPRELAFAGSTFGVWMVLMAMLGGKGTLWGPVIGAVIFHTTQELFWTYLLGWQRVAMGVFIVCIVLFFPMGIVGWFRRMRPKRFSLLKAAPRFQRAAHGHE
jgi:branched-chain amino acid transport system permease protein